MKDLHLLSFRQLSWRTQFWVMSTHSERAAAASGLVLKTEQAKPGQFLRFSASTDEASFRAERLVRVSLKSVAVGVEHDSRHDGRRGGWLLAMMGRLNRKVPSELGMRWRGTCCHVIAVACTTAP